MRKHVQAKKSPHVSDWNLKALTVRWSVPLYAAVAYAIAVVSIFISQ